jgi:predicted permease
MDWRDAVRAAFHAAMAAPDDDVIEELALHAEAAYEAARAEGLSPAEAEGRVAGQIEAWRMEAHDLRRRPPRPKAVEPPPIAPTLPFRGVTQDMRYAARLLRRHPQFAVLAVLTMALGIGAATVLFSVTYGVLLKPLPWPHGDRVIVLKETRGGKAPRFGGFSSTAYLAWREKAVTIEEIGAWSSGTATLAGTGDPERIRVTSASASLFAVLGVRPLIGSLFEAQQEGSHVVVLSEGLWRQRFGGDPAVVGKPLNLDGQSRTILGVLPDRFAFPDRQARVWVPLEVRPPVNNDLSMFNAVALLRPGVTAAQAASEGTARGRFAVDTGITTTAVFGGEGPIDVSAASLGNALAAEVRRPLLVLLVAVGLLLVTATANVASLQLTRATTRRREIAIRAAHGAGGVRLTQQLLVESLLLGGTGGAVGLVLAALAHRLLPSVLPPDFPRIDELGIDATVLLFAAVVSVVTSVLFGTLPALQARRVNLVESLGEDGTASVGPGRGSPRARLRLLIMAGQVAITCVLLVGASLLGRSFVALLTADRGYEASGVMTARVMLPDWLFSAERRYAVLDQILGHLTEMPGVARAAFTSELPLTPGGSTAAFTLRSRSAGSGVVSAQASPRVVSDRYFSTLGMRIVEGRGFANSDMQGSLPVVVVNRTFARRYLGSSPLGAQLPMGVGYEMDGREATVIGVVDDVRYLTSVEPPPPEMYFSYRQLNGRVKVPVVTFLLRSEGDTAWLASAIRLAIRQADARLVADAVMRMDDRVMRGLARPRLYAILLGSFAVLALLIAAVGLFGVLSYVVAQRSREFALRTALGARPLDILRLVLQQGIAATGTGIAAGLVVAVALTRSIAALLYGVTPYDGLTFVTVPAAVLLVAAGACAAPALRAARLHPMSALRS